MSQNPDLVRSIYADWESGDLSSAEWADPDIEFVIAGGPSPGRWTGRAKMVAAWGEFLATWMDRRTARRGEEVVDVE
jgi:ketosteroid isomerase-like protein